MMLLAIISLGVSYCQRANHRLFEHYSIGFLFRRPLSLQSGISSNRSTVTESDSCPLLWRNRTELAGGLYLRSNRATLRRTVSQTFYVRENQILKPGRNFPKVIL